jgi:hypothetical protein
VVAGSTLLKTVIDGLGQAVTLRDMPSALTEVATSGRFLVDLTTITDVFLSGVVAVTDSSTGEVRVQYRRPTDNTWRYLDGNAGPTLSLAVAGEIEGASVPVEADARGRRWCRVVTINGDGAKDPRVGHVALHGGVSAASAGGDWQQLISLLGGDAEVPFFYDWRYGVTPYTGGKAESIDDVRGATGYGPQIGSPGFPGDFPVWDAAVGEAQFALGSPSTTLVDLSGPFTLIYVGSITSGGSGLKFIAGVGTPITTPTTVLGIRAGATVSGEALASGSRTTLASGVALGTAIRLAVVAQDGGTGMTFDCPNAAQQAGALAGAMTPTSAYIDFMEQTNGDTGNRGVGRARALIGVKHVLTAAELQAVKAWAQAFRGASLA